MSYWVIGGQPQNLEHGLQLSIGLGLEHERCAIHHTCQTGQV